MRLKIVGRYLSYSAYIGLIGCGHDGTQSTRDASVIERLDTGQDGTVDENTDATFLPDSGPEDPEACEMWLLRNRELVDALTEDAVPECEVGSYGRCGEGRLLEIDCGNARHTWCNSTNQNDSGEVFTEGFTELLSERCEVAPPGCLSETTNVCPDLVPFCMPDGQCELLEDRAEGDCDDIRSQVFSGPSRPTEALCRDGVWEALPRRPRARCALASRRAPPGAPRRGRGRGRPP